jgi:acyl carrier protein
MITKAELVELLREDNVQPPPGGFALEARLVDQGLDSLDMATFMHNIERRWDLVISVEEAAAMRSLADFLALVNARLAAR